MSDVLNLIYLDEMQDMIEKEILYGVEMVKKVNQEISRVEKILETTKDPKKQAAWEFELENLRNWRLAKHATPMMFWGPPGSAKTQGIHGAVKDTIEKHGLRVGIIFTYLSAYDAVAVRGMPVVDRERRLTDWYPQSAFPSEDLCNQYDVVVWVLDELSAAPKSIQPPIYRLLQEGQIEGYKVPRNVLMIAAGNDKDDRAIAIDMSSAMANRIVHFDVRPSLDAWKNWGLRTFTHLVDGVRTHIHPMVIAFHNSNDGEYLHKMDTETMGMMKGFPTLRSWEKVSDDLYKYANASERMRELRVIGHVGQEAGAAFNTFYRIHDKLPDADRILNGEIRDIPEEDHLKYAVLSNLVVHLMKKCNAERIENFFSYITEATKHRKEMGYMAVSDAFRAGGRQFIKELRMVDSWREWADIHVNMESW